jgi:hypothetical protein
MQGPLGYSTQLDNGAAESIENVTTLDNLDCAKITAAGIIIRK